MNARVKIGRDFERFVRSDSTATLKKAFGVAGDSFMEITRGTNAPLPAYGATIVCLATEELPARIERMLEELRAELVPVVKKAGVTFDEWTKLGTDLQKTDEQLHQLVTRLDGLATGVEQGKGTAGKLLTDTALTDEAQKLLARANEAMGEFQGVVTNLSAAVKNVQNGTTRLPEITAALANEAKDLPGLVQQTQTSMRELERLVEAVQRHWLLRQIRQQNRFRRPAPRGRGRGTEQEASEGGEIATESCEVMSMGANQVLEECLFPESQRDSATKS